MQPVEPTKPISFTPAAVQPPPALDEADVKSRSRAWFAALDRFDLAAIEAPLASSFVLFEDQRFYDRELLLQVQKGRREKNMPVRSREWSDERVFVTPNSAIFIGRAVETIPAFGDTAATNEDGYNTLVWSHDGARWQLVLWEWVRGGADAEKQRWNDAYRQGYGFNTKPNQLLVDTVKGRKPGTAIDIAMGQGRNAVFLATQGWKTTGIDISDEGIRQAKAEAARLKVKLDTIEADVDTYDYGKEKWDLVTVIYAGADPTLVEKLKPAIKKGGLFVSEYFHADAEVAKAGAGGWKTGELAALFEDGWKVLRDDVVDDNADWAGQRKTKLVRFVAQKL